MRRALALLAGFLLLVAAAVFLLQSVTDEPGEGESREPAADRAAASVETTSFESAAAPEPVAPALPQLGSEERAPAPLVEGPPADAATIVGRVVDEQHAPRSRAEVLIASDDQLVQLYVGAGGKPGSQGSFGRAGAEGRFELQVPPHHELTLLLSAPRGGWQRGTEFAALPGQRLDLGDVVLHGASVVRGRVLDDAGRPIAGAEVLCTDRGSVLAAWFQMGRGPVAAQLEELVYPDEAWIQAWTGRLRLAEWARTDEDGRFEVKLASRDGEQIFAAARAPGFSIATIEAQAPPGSAADVLLELVAAPARLAGRVRRLDGSPAPPDTVVTAAWSAHSRPIRYGRAARVGREGRFEIEGLLDAPYALSATCSDSMMQEPVIVAAGTRDAELVLGAPLAVIARVTRDGEAVESFEVRVRHATGVPLPDGPWESLSSDPRAGGALLVPMRWPFEATLQAFAGGACSQSVTVNLAETGRSRVVGLALVASRHVNGLVVDDSGAPVAQASVELQPGSAGASALTGAEGRFELGPVPASNLKLRVRGPDGQSVLVDVPPPRQPFVVTLPRRTLVQVRPGPLIARVLGADPGARVGIAIHDLDHGGPPRARHFGAQGGFIRDLLAGRYRIDVFHDKERLRGPQFTALAGQLVVLEL